MHQRAEHRFKMHCRDSGGSVTALDICAAAAPPIPCHLLAPSAPAATPRCTAPAHERIRATSILCPTPECHSPLSGCGCVAFLLRRCAAWCHKAGATAREASAACTRRSYIAAQAAASAVLSGHTWQTFVVVASPPLLTGEPAARRRPYGYTSSAYVVAMSHGLRRCGLALIW